MGDRDAAQAAELVRALRHQLHEITAQLARVERQGVTGRNGRACAMRLEAAALRRDIREAQVLIDRLQRRYLSGDERTQQRPAGGQSRAMVETSKPSNNAASPCRSISGLPMGMAVPGEPYEQVRGARSQPAPPWHPRW
jgi:hypothetical protein